MKKAIVIILSIILVMSMILPAAALSTIAVKGIKLDSSNIMLKVGQTATLKVAFTPANTTQKLLAYVTANKKVADADKNGKITAIGVGNTTISVYTSNKNISAKCTVTVSASALKPGDGPLVKYKDPVELSVADVTSATWSYITGDDKDNNFHTRLNKQYLNIVYKSKWSVDETKLDERVNLAIASNDLPDALSVNANELQMVVKNGQVQDMTDIYDDYGLDNFKKNESFQNNVAFLPATSKGRIYGLPLTLDFGESVPVLYVRKDWLDNLGLTPPKTMNDVLNIAKAFVNDDPDNNGKKDTFAIALDNTQFGSNPDARRSTVDSIAAAYGAYRQKWLKDSTGKLVYGSIQPQMQSALGMMQQLYKLGAFDPEFAIKDFSKITEEINANKIGIYYGIYSGAIDPLYYFKQANTDGDWICLPIPSATGKEIIPPAKPFTNRWVVVRKGYSYPEAVVKSMNLQYEMQYPDPGTTNTVIKAVAQAWWDACKPGGAYTGKFANLYMKPYVFASVDATLQACLRLDKYQKTGDKSILTASDVSGLAAYKSYPAALKWGFQKIWYGTELIIGNYKKLQYSDYQGAPTTSMVSKGPALDKIETDAFTKIIMGADLQSTFNDFVTQWKSLGGDQITKEVNDAANQ